MCIMEVRPGQRSDTIAQACAHNTSTIERDLDMFEELLKARRDSLTLSQVEYAHDHLRKAYASLLAVFGIEVGKVVEDPEGHVHEHDGEHGSERTLIGVAHHDAGLARRYETR
jgi:hypothetical protein